MLVATLGKMPRFFWRFLFRSSSSSSPVPSPDPTDASPRKDPVAGEKSPEVGNEGCFVGMMQRGRGEKRGVSHKIVAISKFKEAVSKRKKERTVIEKKRRCWLDYVQSIGRLKRRQEGRKFRVSVSLACSFALVIVSSRPSGSQLDWIEYRQSCTVQCTVRSSFAHILWLSHPFLVSKCSFLFLLMSFFVQCVSHIQSIRKHNRLIDRVLSFRSFSITKLC